MDDFQVNYMDDFETNHTVDFVTFEIIFFSLWADNEKKVLSKSFVNDFEEKNLIIVWIFQL